MPRAHFYAIMAREGRGDMRDQKIHRGIFLERPNRFIAHVAMEDEIVICHVKNTGRCRELLVPGAVVWLEQAVNPARKTKFDLIAVEKKTDEEGGRPLAVSTEGEGSHSMVRLINMDAQAPNQVFGEWMAAGGGESAGLPRPALLRPETAWGNSRFDFYWEAAGERGFVEVKGVTLEENGAVRFPDAPTERGVKHLGELVSARRAGYDACVFFVIQMEGANYFSPNDATHPAFGDALRVAAAAGVKVLAWDCSVTPDSLAIRQAVEVRL